MFVLCSFVAASISAQAQNLVTIRQRAEAGSAEAQYELAKAYYSGTGVATDPKQGLEWLRKSASQGYPAAEFALGVMFQEGERSVSQNPHEAAYWFRKAAIQQNKQAQDHLSQMLEEGLISEQEANWRAYQRTSEKKKSQPRRFSLAEVEMGLLGGVTSKRMETLVRRFGVDFRLSNVSRERLLSEGADDNLLNTISVSNE